MILYKYTNYKGGYELLMHNSIGFRQPEFLNDPMELSAAYPKDDYVDETDRIEMSRRRQLKEFAWRNYYAILSLTRAPNNPLMWSHYAENNKGFVIGFEVNQALFASEKFNLIPVQYGSVIYTTTKPIHEIISKSDRVVDVGTEVKFIPERFESFQRIFLYKPICWAYEEEVRVVKNIFRNNSSDNFKSGDFTIKNVGGHDLFIYSLPKKSIKEIHFGFKNPLLEKNAKKYFLESILPNLGDPKLFISRPEGATWDLRSAEIRTR